MLAGQFVLPDAEDFPAALPERAVHQAVARFVARKFLFPKSVSGGGLCSVLRTAVPETAVNKHRQFNFRKNKIRFAENFLIPPPAGDAVTAK